MRRFFALALFGLLASTAPVAAQQGKDAVSSCDGSTYEMVECQKAKLAILDKQLNVAYQAALQRAEGKQRDQLRAAQRLWIRYRDANCLYYDLGEGTIARLEAGECMLNMTRNRAEELEQAIKP